MCWCVLIWLTFCCCRPAEVQGRGRARVWRGQTSKLTSERDQLLKRLAELGDHVDPKVMRCVPLLRGTCGGGRLSLCRPSWCPYSRVRALSTHPVGLHSRIVRAS